MSAKPRWRLIVPLAIRQFPPDLGVTIGLLALAVASILLPVVRETPLRFVLALLVFAFVPGYAFVAALFPRGDTTASAGDVGRAATRIGPRGIDGVERLALSVVSSVLIVGLTAFALTQVSVGARVVPILTATGVFTVVATAIAATRRLSLAEPERFSVPYREWLGGIRPGGRGDASPVVVGLNVLLVVAVLAAATSVAFAVSTPGESESYTEAYLLTKADDGSLVAADYPDDAVAGEEVPLVVGVANHEFDTRTYTVVASLQRVDPETDAVTEAEELERFTLQLDHDESWTREHTVTPTMTGERLRLSYLVYEGEAPAEPTPENAYREVHLWISVSEPAAE